MSWFESIRRAVSLTTRGVRRDEGVRLRSEVVRLCQENRYAEAAKVAQNLVDWQRTEIGEAHPDFARGLLNLALILRKQGSHPEANLVLERAASLLRAALGPDHPLTVEADSLLDSWRVEDTPKAVPGTEPQTPTPEPADETLTPRRLARQEPGLLLAIAELSSGRAGNNFPI